MHTVIPEQMRIGFNATQIIDRNAFHIAAIAFDHRTQNKAPDAPEPIDGNLHGHDIFLPQRS
jgi:hypothetical protein